MARRGSCDCYRDAGIPRRWEEALEFDWVGAAREALTSIMPETEMGNSARYLSRARSALFLSRALEAIKKGELVSPMKQINSLLSGIKEPLVEDLEDAKERAIRNVTKRDFLNKNVQRVKAAYALAEAQKSMVTTE
jgi:hypothetical protein